MVAQIAAQRQPVMSSSTAVRNSEIKNSIHAVAKRMRDFEDIADLSNLSSKRRPQFLFYFLRRLDTQRFLPGFPSLVRLLQGFIDIAQVIVNRRVRLLGKLN